MSWTLSVSFFSMVSGGLRTAGPLSLAEWLRVALWKIVCVVSNRHEPMKERPFLSGYETQVSE